MAQRDAEKLQRIAALNPVALAWWALLVLVRAILDFLNRLGRHWFMLLVLLGGVCLAIRGSILLDYGVAFLFREDGQLSGYSLGTLLRSPAFFTELFAVLLAGAAWVFAVDLDKSHTDETVDPDGRVVRVVRPAAQGRFYRELPSLGVRILLLGIAPLLALRFPASPAIPPVDDPQLIRAILGWLAGFGLALSVISLAQLIEVGLQDTFDSRDRDRRRAAKVKSRLRKRIESWIDWDNLIWRVIILWMMYVATWMALVALTVELQLRLPTVAIFALAGLALAAYVVLNFVIERMRFYAVIAVVGLAALLHQGDPFGFRVPGLQAHYEACRQDDAKGSRADTDPLRPVWCGKSGAPAVNQPVLLKNADFQRMIDLRVQIKDSLKGFKEWQHSQSRLGNRQAPKLVVVTISGGAYRAAFWGALVLDRLRQESAPGGRLEGLAQSIRLLTGASGGMVPAAYFVTLQPDEIAPGGQQASLVEQIKADISGSDSKTTQDRSLDSLSPIAQQLVRHDIFNAFNPWSSYSDRGGSLEAQWKRLDHETFADLRPAEEVGRRASLIFAPMIAETGQPLLISNLDLSQISNPLNHQTLDLFEALPEAMGELKLSTAVRMSATFPFVTPSASLPTRPALHVLDAGYLDNYGMGVALAYLKQQDVVDWVSKNTSGVILIQINAFPAQPSEGSAHSDACNDIARVASADWISRALTAVAYPLSGLFNSRGASTRFRNDQEFDTLQKLLAAAPSGRSIRLDRVIFTNTARASFSWYLPKQDLGCMRQELNARDFNEQLGDLVTLWTAEGSAPAAAAAPSPLAAAPTAGPATTATLLASPGAQYSATAASLADDSEVPPEPDVDPAPLPKP